MRRKIIGSLFLICAGAVYCDATVGKIVINGVEIGNSSNSSGEAYIKGSGKITHSQRKLDKFEELSVDGGFSVSYEASNENSIEIVGDDNIIPLIVAQVAGNKLTVYPDKSFSSQNTIQLLIKSAKLNSINLSGTTSGLFHGIQSDSLKLEVAGTGDAVIDGKVSSLDVTAEGTGNLDLKSIAASKATVNINGTGRVTLTVSGHLDANIIGVGNIVYYGKPTITKNILGVGEIVGGE